MSQQEHTSYFFTSYEKRFFFLFGKTDDEFCPGGLGLYNIEEMLHSQLKKAGYQRIVFFNGQQKIYFYDRESKRLCKRQDATSKNNSNASRVQSSSKKESKLCAGPLGMNRLCRQLGQESVQQNSQSSAPHVAQNDEEALDLGGMNDLSMVGLLNHCMHDENTKTAVVYSDGLDFINFTESEAQRSMAFNLGTWSSRLFSTNQNICIFIFPGVDMTEMENALENHLQWKFLKNQMFTDKGQPTSQVYSIVSPRQDEISNLIHYIRLKRNLRLDWQSLPDAVITITRNICSQGKKLKNLGAQLLCYQDLSAQSLSILTGDLKGQRALERLNSMQGVEPVKTRLHKMIALKQESMGQEKINMQPGSLWTVNRLVPEEPKMKKNIINLHLVLKGNPGTGKTTVAKLMGEIFRDAGFLELGHVVKASREDLVGEYVGHTAIKTSQKIKEAMGGVLFIDEAYSLIEKGESDFGPEAVVTILEAMENHKGEFSVVVAGYPDRIDNFLDSNPGLRRRFGEKNILTIPDYPPELLHKIFVKATSEKERSLCDTLRQALPDFFSNWYGARDQKSFGNAGAVNNLIEAMEENRAERELMLKNNHDKSEQFVLAAEDIPQHLQCHLKPRELATVEDALVRLNGLIGLTEVKEWVRRNTYYIRWQQEQRERGGADVIKVAGHYVFTGNPGTGKTTVARVWGSILHLLGLIGRNEVLEIRPTDLIDKALGETGQKSRRIYEKALGGVLFIDEAHQLASEDSLGRPAIRELVPFMLNNKDNVCVIVAGYPEAMERFLDVDSGLRSRFTDILHFDDFNEDELYSIYTSLLSQNQEHQGPGLENYIQQLFSMWIADKDKHFGNARDVNNLLEKMRQMRAERLAGNNFSQYTDEAMLTFMPEDIPKEDFKRLGGHENDIDAIIKSLNQLIGLERVKEMVKTMTNRLKVEKMRAKDASLAPGHYLFTGNPGTGKTTVARLVGDIFRALGLLKKGHLVEVGRSDLVAGYQGQTAIKTTEMLNRALDGVLFIDEAYQLIQSPQDSFGKEALETLVAYMENHKDRLCIICAGYPELMDDFVNHNPGLPSRFSGKIIFDNYTAEELQSIFNMMAEERNLELGQGVEESLAKVFRKIHHKADASFGNAREVRNLLETMCGRQANRLAREAENHEFQAHEKLFWLTVEDIPQALHDQSEADFDQNKTEKYVKPPFFEPINKEILPTTYPRHSATALELIEPSLLFIVAESKNEEATGSGFIISSCGLALTCEHVVENCSKIWARIKDGDQKFWHRCEVLKTIKNIDMALIKLDAKNLSASILAAPERKPKKGEPVGLLGYPLGHELSQDSNYTEGTITSIQSDEYGTLVQCSALAYPGNSGGPVFSKGDGRVMGLLYGALDRKDAKGINFFRPIEYAWKCFFK